jgi:hypothetical protein
MGYIGNCLYYALDCLSYCTCEPITLLSSLHLSEQDTGL